MTPDMPADSADPVEQTRYGAVIERFTPSAASVIGVWVFAVVMLVGGAAFNVFFLREAAVMPGNIEMERGSVTDRLVRGVLPTLIGWGLIAFGVGLAGVVRAIQKQWVEVCEGGLRHDTRVGVREVPWRMVTAIHELAMIARHAVTPIRSVGVDVLVKRGEALAFDVDSIHKFKRFSRILRERTTAEGIEWLTTGMVVR